MPLAEEPLPGTPSSDPTASTRWSFRDPSDPPLPDDDPTQPFCARHAATVARLTRASFGPHLLGADLAAPPPFRDWQFGKLDDVVARRGWCRACALVSDAIDTEAYGDQAEVIACWVWDGVLSGTGEATLRLRIAPEMVGWESSFEPFDLAPLDSATGPAKGDSGLFMGRRVVTDRLDLPLVKSWVKNCAEWHGAECVNAAAWKTSDWGVPFIRLISLAEDKLVECPSPPPYAALSYVWGSAPVFKTLEGNIAGLMQPGGLSSQKFPKSICDAISLARTLGFGFLWIDSICIIQDSPADKAQQIRIMDGIYSRASLTIVAAAGADANAGIPGLGTGSRSLAQHTIKISDDLTLVALHPDSHRSVTATSWNTRGWTYQERLLSRRCLYSFPDGSVAFQCAKAVWGEDYRAETPHLVRCAPMMEVSLNRSWMTPGSVRERGPSTVRIKKTPYLQEYSRLVEQYTGRQMTYASDRLLGIDGVLDVLRREFGLRFLQGLPESVFHLALLWQPRDKLRRVPKDEKTGLPLFPSWSWGGWLGPVGYENWNDFNGLPELEERARRTTPFSKLGIAGSTRHIRSSSASASSGELPAGWSPIPTASDGVCYILNNNNERYHSVPFVCAPPGPLGHTNGNTLHPLGLLLRTRVARFRVTNLIRTFDMNRSTPAVERNGRFGIAMPSPATSDRPWLGTILLPVQYHARLARDHEFIVFSESYGFSRQEMAPTFAEVRPFAVYDVMMIRRVAGEELERYRRAFAAASSSAADAVGGDWWSGKMVVERIGVGRMLKAAWEEGDTWEDFVIV